MKIIKLFTICLFYILSYIIPKKENLYIFWSIDWKSFSSNSKTLYLYIKKYKKYISPIYISEYEWFISPNSIKSFILLLRAKYIFVETDLSQISKYILAYQPWKIKVINLWHWEPIKKIWFDANILSSQKKKNIILFLLYKNFFNNKVILWSTCSYKSQENLNNSQLTNKFKTTWLSRNDIFFDKNLITKDIKKDLNLENKKIILYTPTYRDNWKNYTPIKNIKILNNFLGKNNYILLIKAHHWDEKINIIESSNIINISNNKYDIQELLYYTDILISDYSSLYIDFLLTNKLILFYPYDKKEYLKNRNLYFKYEDVTIKETTANNEKELFNIIKNIDSIKDKKVYKDKYNKIKNLFHKYQNWWYCENILKKLK
jgi:CDP-glycerol glycerophosphotransferase (TagB/SpsB family)